MILQELIDALNKAKNKTTQILIDMLNMIKDKIEYIKYLILYVILKCLMKVFKMTKDDLREAFIKSWRTEYDTTRENKTES